MYGTQTGAVGYHDESAVWEWCKNVWYSNLYVSRIRVDWFENDVKMYGTQTVCEARSQISPFENDVKMYGTQTAKFPYENETKFENDVKMYGTQTHWMYSVCISAFENDVKMYGTQTSHSVMIWGERLRMM